MIKINESPRDAMQALKTFISTEKKVEYIKLLLKVGFDILDVGSFVSSKAVPQMSDTKEVLKNIIIEGTDTKISVLAGNSYFAEKVAEYDVVDYINYPLGISETFQKRNMNSNFNKSFKTIDKILDTCSRKNKKPIITLSEAFGNPYDDDWGIDILMDWIDLLYERDLRYIPLADTTASGSDHIVGLVFDNVIREFPDVEFNFHLHTKSEETTSKIEKAYHAGCRNFDTVFNGMGGCPMSGKDLVANLNTVDFINWLNTEKIDHKIKTNFFEASVKKAVELFP